MAAKKNILRAKYTNWLAVQSGRWHTQENSKWAKRKKRKKQ